MSSKCGQCAGCIVKAAPGNVAARSNHLRRRPEVSASPPGGRARFGEVYSVGMPGKDRKIRIA